MPTTATIKAEPGKIIINTPSTAPTPLRRYDLDRNRAADMDNDLLRRFMAQDIAELSKIDPEGSVTRTDLVRLGWSRGVVEAHGLAASAMVNEILNERRPGPDPSMTPAGLRLLANIMVEKAESIGSHRAQLQSTLTQNSRDTFSALARIDQHITALRREARAMAALGDAIAHTIARLQTREPLRGLR